MKKHSIYFYFLLVLLFSSCERVITIDLPEPDAKLVVNSFLVEGEPIRIHISRSVGIFGETDPTKRIVTDATVEILKNGGSLGNMKYVDTTYIDPLGAEIYQWGYFGNNLIVESLASYEVKVSHKDFPSVSATTSIPEAPRVENITYTADAAWNEVGESLDELLIKLNDPAGIANYYHIQAQIYYMSKDSNLESKTVFFVPRGFLTQRSFQGGALFDDRLFDGQIAEIPLFFERDFIDDDPGVLIPKVVLIEVEVRNSNRDYFEYQQKFETQQSVQDGRFAFFAVEPVSMYSNVENGFGIFAAYSAFRETIVP